MDPALIAQAVMAVLSMVEGLLPQLGVASNAIPIVDGIITTLTKVLPIISQLAPIIGDEVKLMYQGVKNIIANLRGTQTSAEQDAALDALDAEVDAGWNSISAQFDPDAASTAKPSAS